MKRFYRASFYQDKICSHFSFFFEVLRFASRRIPTYTYSFFRIGCVVTSSGNKLSLPCASSRSTDYLLMSSRTDFKLQNFVFFLLTIKTSEGSFYSPDLVQGEFVVGVNQIYHLVWVNQPISGFCHEQET